MGRGSGGRVEVVVSDLCPKHVRVQVRVGEGPIDARQQCTQDLAPDALGQARFAVVLVVFAALAALPALFTFVPPTLLVLGLAPIFLLLLTVALGALAAAHRRLLDFPGWIGV